MIVFQAFSTFSLSECAIFTINAFWFPTEKPSDFSSTLICEIETIEIEIPGQGSILKPDLVNFTSKEVIEVKSGVSRKYIREAIGQVLDYVFQIEKIEKLAYQPVILVPGEVSSDLSDLLVHLHITLIFENSAGEFVRN